MLASSKQRGVLICLCYAKHQATLCCWQVAFCLPAPKCAIRPLVPNLLFASCILQVTNPRLKSPTSHKVALETWPNPGHMLSFCFIFAHPTVNRPGPPIQPPPPHSGRRPRSRAQVASAAHVVRSGEDGEATVPSLPLVAQVLHLMKSGNCIKQFPLPGREKAKCPLILQRVAGKVQSETTPKERQVKHTDVQNVQLTAW